MYLKNHDIKKSNRLLVRIFVIAGSVLAGLLIFRFFFSPCIVNDASMNPGIKKGDYVLISRRSGINNGAVVLFNSPVEKNKVLLKRVIASEGDIISIRNKTIYINNKKLLPKWKMNNKDTRSFPMTFSFRDNMPGKKLKRDEFFVIGDNFDQSFDSRSFGNIHANNIIGKMIYHYQWSE